nr:hypothetical protein [Tanacetum cinerariifolium]
MSELDLTNDKNEKKVGQSRMILNNSEVAKRRANLRLSELPEA